MPASSRSVSRAARPAAPGRPVSRRWSVPPDRLGGFGPAEDLEPSSPVYPCRQPRRVPGDDGVAAGVVLQLTGVGVGQRPQIRPLPGPGCDQRVVAGPVGDPASKPADLRRSSASTTVVLAAFATTRNSRRRSGRPPGRRRRRRPRRTSSCTGPAWRQRGQLPDDAWSRAAAAPGPPTVISPIGTGRTGPRPAHGQMLGGLAPVAQRHEPAGEAGQRRSQFLVDGQQRRGARRSGAGWRAGAPAGWV